MVTRPDPRHAARLHIKVRGTDPYGQPFRQTAYTRDISRRGARLDGAPSILNPASVIEVQHGWRKARFRVVWVGGPGTREQAQAGIQSLEPSTCIWGQPLPGKPLPATEPPAPTEPAWSGGEV